jgi:hypothetical protein
LIRAARHTFFVFSMTGGVMPSTPVPAQTPASDPTVSKADGDLYQPNHSRWESSEQWRAQMSVCYEPVRRSGRTYPMRTPTCCIESIATSSYDGSSSVWTVTWGGGGSHECGQRAHPSLELLTCPWLPASTQAALGMAPANEQFVCGGADGTETDLPTDASFREAR